MSPKAPGRMAGWLRFCEPGGMIAGRRAVALAMPCRLERIGSLSLETWATLHLGAPGRGQGKGLMNVDL